MITGQIKNQIKAAVKVNTEMFEFYWTMDREISKLHKSAKWGSAFFDCLSLDLKTEFPNQSGFSAANIRYSKRWYEFYNQGDIILQRIVEEIRQQLVDEFRQQIVTEFAGENLHQLGGDMPHDLGLVP